MTHLPQVKSIRSDIIELGDLLHLNRILHTTPYFMAPNFDRKNLFANRGADYPAEQVDGLRHLVSVASELSEPSRVQKLDQTRSGEF